MQEIRRSRAVIALLCIALLLFCAGAAAHNHELTLPALVFCFLVVFALSLLPLAERKVAVQPIVLLRVRSSRAPPRG